MSRYHASLIGGQNIIFKPFIDISSDSVRFRVPGFLSGEEQTISIESITEIGISGSIISKTISIYTTGMGAINAEGFSPSDAKAVQREIEQNKKELQRRKQEERNQSNQQRSYQREEQSEAQAKKKEFTNIDLIPLISFSSYAPQLFADINALLQYANAELKTKPFEIWNRKKVEAYINKLEEGERMADSLDVEGDSYLKKERNLISEKIEILKLSLESKLKGKRNRRLIKWAIWIIVILYIWRHYR